MKVFFGGILLIFLFGACQNKEVYMPEIRHSKKMFSVPEDNPLTVKKIALGRQLFYDKGFSLDSSISCASCHLQEYAFVDTAKVSSGFHGQKGFRNAPTLANLAFQTTFFYDGAIKSIERAVHPPLLTDVEMNMNLEDLLARLASSRKYQQLFHEAFHHPPDYKSFVYALASFQRTLISQNAPYDDFFMGNKNALSNSAKRGLTLFKSQKLNCATCHRGPFFTDNEVHNIGLDSVYEDYGNGRLTRNEQDFGKMRTPTLRNIALTAPYMHNGSIETLNDVISFYARGGENHPNKSKEIKAFEISETEKRDLIAFLHSLTDSTFLVNPAFSAPN